MSLIALPVASRKTAFIAGVSLSALVFLLGTLKGRGVIPYDADSPQLFPFVLVYFFVSVLLLVIDVRSIAPKELKTRFPGVYFPTNREGVGFMFRVWGRMIVWFLGVVIGGTVLMPLDSYLK
jgi:hypothetical protein